MILFLGINPINIVMVNEQIEYFKIKIDSIMIKTNAEVKV